MQYLLSRIVFHIVVRLHLCNLFMVFKSFCVVYSHPDPGICNSNPSILLVPLLPHVGRYENNGVGIILFT
jgi:hypothetical protein